MTEIKLGREYYHHIRDIEKWCRDNVGKDHYSWTGSTFWFETETAAMWFALRWS